MKIGKSVYCHFIVLESRPSLPQRTWADMKSAEKIKNIRGVSYNKKFGLRNSTADRQ
jgi:hypothetical protein